MSVRITFHIFKNKTKKHSFKQSQSAFKTLNRTSTILTRIFMCIYLVYLKTSKPHKLKLKQKCVFSRTIAKFVFYNLQILNIIFVSYNVYIYEGCQKRFVNNRICVILNGLIYSCCIPNVFRKIANKTSGFDFFFQNYTEI